MKKTPQIFLISLLLGILACQAPTNEKQASHKPIPIDYKKEQFQLYLGQNLDSSRKWVNWVFDEEQDPDGEENPDGINEYYFEENKVFKGEKVELAIFAKTDKNIIIDFYCHVLFKSGNSKEEIKEFLDFLSPQISALKEETVRNELLDEDLEYKIETNDYTEKFSIGISEENWLAYIVAYEYVNLFALEDEEDLLFIFKFSETEPVQLVENTGQDKVSIAGHSFTWMPDENRDKIKVKIDDQVFRLNSDTLLNAPSNGKKRELGFTNDWKRLSYYDYEGCHLLFVELKVNRCSGLACSYTNYLIYDLDNKTRNYFGHFVTGEDLRLHDFRFDGKINFVTNDFYGEPLEFPFTRVKELYSLNETGEFTKPLKFGERPFSIKVTVDEIGGKLEYDWFSSN